ncbi:hypothetical protein, partial [Zobellia barbeyronii]|uniref:hypothetical protein n=1 Tax=Zobellia barbeyronii TaxID=2748009 RepID=UPI001BDFD482
SRGMPGPLREMSVTGVVKKQLFMQYVFFCSGVTRPLGHFPQRLSYEQYGGKLAFAFRHVHSEIFLF